MFYASYFFFFTCLLSLMPHLCHTLLQPKERGLYLYIQRFCVEKAEIKNMLPYYTLFLFDLIIKCTV